ncbi:MAG TPA: peptidase, partial [Chthoniobacterales bacterium]
RRPNRIGAREIYRIYLTENLPYAASVLEGTQTIGEAIDRLVNRLLDVQFAKTEQNKFLEITLRSGRKENVYRSDLLSGAIIASVVERAKGMAIKRAITNLADPNVATTDGITEEDLQSAFNAEFSENDIFPPTDVAEDWFKLIDYDPENVVKIAPSRALAATAAPQRTSGVI